MSWVLGNSRTIITDPIPYDADEATTNIAIADVTRKDRRDMLQKLTDAKRALTIAERGFTDARGVEADMYREEIDIVGELNEAHDRTCRARVVTQDRAKAVRQAKEEVRNIKNVLYGATYGAGQRDVFSAIYSGRHADVVAVAVAKAAEAADVAQTAKVKAVDAFNEVLALKASLAEIEADVEVHVAQRGQ